MKSVWLVLLALCFVTSPAWAELAHVEDSGARITRKAAREIDWKLVKFQEETGINVIMQFHAASPSEAEDTVPGAYMKALATKLGTIEDGVLLVYFSDVNEWRMWVGNELTSRFAGKPGTAAELTKSGEMHDAKEAWFEQVFADVEMQWQRWNETAHVKPKPDEKVRFEAAALVDGLKAKFAAAAE
jgi:hypothetical protein